MSVRSFVCSSAALAAAMTLAVPALAEQQQGTTGKFVPVPIEAKKQGDVQYVSGGIGDTAQSRMKSMADDYNLRVTLANPEGHYLDGTKVRIEDQSGKVVLNVESQGPLFFADVPPGQYTVQATGPKGNTEKTTTRVSEGNPASVVLHLG